MVLYDKLLSPISRGLPNFRPNNKSSSKKFSLLSQQNDLLFWATNYLPAALAAATILSKRLSPRKGSQHGLTRRSENVERRTSNTELKGGIAARNSRQIQSMRNVVE
jgi:hypothetical protein